MGVWRLGRMVARRARKETLAGARPGPRNKALVRHRFPPALTAFILLWPQGTARLKH